MPKKDKLEILLWSIALPGFGQLLNGKYVKGLALIVLEIIINVLARINMGIVHSFHGNIELAVAEVDYQWLMFYPCIYTFGMWDAYRDAGGRDTPYSFLPFVFAAFTGTIGTIYSTDLLGPIFLPIISFCVGAGVGIGIRYFVRK